MPNNRPEILPRLEGANMPLGESFSFMQQTVTGLVWVPGMPGAGPRRSGMQGWRQGGQGWSPEGQLGSCDLGHCLGPGFLLCKMGVIILASEGGGIK